MILSVTASGTRLPVADALLTAVLGYGVVFLGLMMLMAIVCLLGVFFKARARRNAQIAAPTPTESAAQPASPAPAPGTAGQVALYDVSDQEAAMIMAIVANQLGKPLNELRFKTIKEVKDDEV